MCHAASPAATNTTRRRSPPSLPSPRSPLRPMLTLRAARRGGRARPRLLTDHVEEPLPARSAESGQRVPDPLDDARPVVLLARRLVGPVDEQRASLDLVDRQEAPEAAVAAVVPVVPEHEQLPGGHHLRAPGVADRLAAVGVLGV